METNPIYVLDNLGGLECINVIEALGLNYNMGNVMKYVWRYKRKGGLDDLEKAYNYLGHEIQRLRTGGEL